MRKWTPLLFSSELALILLAGLCTSSQLLALFPLACFIYFMTGGLLFYQLLFDEMTPKRMFRKMARRWIVLTLLLGFFFPIWIVLSFGLLFFFRAALMALLSFLKKRGWAQRKLVIVGSAELPKKLEKIFWSGFRVVSINPTIKELQNLDFEEIWLAFSLEEQQKAVPFLQVLAHSTVNIKLVPNFSSIAPVNLGASNIGRLVAIHLRDTPMQGLNRIVKYLEDKVLAFFILILASPVMLGAALLVRLSSPGPIFYRQERVSWNNESFWMLKFRTMPLMAEATTGPVWASAQDARTTWVGKWLRRTCIDELPQFFNVLKGEMSIVGPRPERPHFIEKFKDEIPLYMQKHRVKAGITGLAQIRGYRGQTDLGRRIEYDLQYIQEWSLWLDLKIILLTLIKGFKNAY